MRRLSANSIAVIVFQILSVVVHEPAGAGCAGIVAGKTIGEGRRQASKSCEDVGSHFYSCWYYILGTDLCSERAGTYAFYHISPTLRRWPVSLCQYLR